MKNVSFARYSPHTADIKLTDQVIECYRDVFADGPWHEWLQCPKCKKYWGTKDQNILQNWNFQHCNTPLVDYWPREKVNEDLRHEITSEASCWLATCNTLVVGFCLGYPITIPNLERKLGISFNSKLVRHLGDHTRVAYQDDVAVRSEFRRQGIATTMVRHRLANFLDLNLRVGVVRTREKPEPSVTFPWYTKKLGYVPIAKYPGEDGRVILARSLIGLKELLSSGA